MAVIFKHILGYLFGLIIFLILLPAGFYGLAAIDQFRLANLDNAILRFIIALPFFLLGLYFIIWSNLYLLFMGKGGPFQGLNVEVSPKTKQLVTNGPYRYSRNPMVFGTLTLYFSLGLFYLSPIAIIGLIIFASLVTVFVLRSEEKRLLKDFGQKFLDYKNKVARLIPFLKIKK